MANEAGNDRDCNEKLYAGMSIAFGWNHLPAGARLTGFCIGMLGDVVFLLSVLCMRDSWRAGIPDKDKTELVTNDIYCFSRNPAFLGFDLMYIGMLLLYGNLLTLGFSVFAIIMLHLQILQEERYLADTFGVPYQEYCRHVFCYILSIPHRHSLCGIGF